MMVHDAIQTWPLRLTEGTLVDFATDALGVEVIGIEPDQSPRLELRGEGSDRVSISVREDGNTVKIRADAHHAHGRRWRDDVRLALFLPRAVTARLQADAGTIDIHGLGPCNLIVHADAGRIRLDDIHGHLRLGSEAGQITGRNLSGRLDVRTNAGSIRLGIVGLEPGEHRVRADVGSIVLELAPHLPVRIDLKVSQGSVQNHYPSTPEAEAVLKVSADLGSVKIRPGDGADEGDAPPHRVRVDVRGFRRGPFGPPPIPPFPPIPPIPPIPPLPHIRTFFGYDTDDDSGWERPERGGRSGNERAGSRPDERPAGRRPVDAEVERILGLVEKGELSATDAEVLLRALDHE